MKDQEGSIYEKEASAGPNALAGAVYWSSDSRDTEVICATSGFTDTSEMKAVDDEQIEARISDCSRKLTRPMIWDLRVAIICRMDTTAILQEIDAEITRLQRARALLTGHAAPMKRGRASDRKTDAISSSVGGNVAAKPKRRRMSAEGRARIAAAQRARWAKSKKG